MSGLERTLRLPVSGAVLTGDLTLPEPALGLVIFAHGSGSSRKSPRNRHVAQTLVDRGLATLLFDLLTPEEEDAERYTRHLRFDIELLAGRLADVTALVRRMPLLASLPIGYFGSSTGAAAALVAAARRPEGVAAVVSRGGRPDLAGPLLAQVCAPTLLVVGGWDDVVIELNEEALAQLRCEKELRIVPGATHLFEEPGTLDEAARHAGEWFEQHLGAAQAAAHRPVTP